MVDSTNVLAQLRRRQRIRIALHAAQDHGSQRVGECERVSGRHEDGVDTGGDELARRAPSKG